MSNIKKNYQDLVAFLEANPNKKVATLLPQIIEMCEAKVNSRTFEKDESGTVTKVFCYYHKVWEDVAVVEYGAKKGTATGLNTMCKEGVRAWSKAQRDAKKAKEELLAKVVSGEIDACDLQTKMDEIEAIRVSIA